MEERLVSQHEPRPKTARDSGYLPTLDGWRAIAVSLVIGSHSVSMIRRASWPGNNAVASLFDHAGYGVDMFFALSGLLITTLLLAEKRRTGTIGLAAFYTRRFFRIIPPMAIYLLVAGTIISTVTMTEIAQSLLFVRNYGVGGWYTGHFWSLSIEEHFYAFMPLMIVFLPKRALLIASLVLIALCIAVRWYEMTYLASSLYQPQFRTENRVDALLWGSVLAQLTDTQQARERVRRLMPPLLVVCVLAIALVILASTGSTPIRRTVTAMVLPIAIASTTLRPHMLIARCLELSIVRYIGRLSYSLYLWQTMFFVRDEHVLGVAQEFPLALILTIALALFSYNGIEKPCIRLGHRLSNRLLSGVNGRFLVRTAGV